MNSIETSLLNMNVIYTDPETEFLSIIHSQFFKVNRVVKGFKITVPDNTTHDYFYWEPPETVHVQNYMNIKLDRLYDVDLIYTVSSAYEEVNPTRDTEYTAYKHGNGLIFETEDTEQEVVVECLIVNKTRADLLEEYQLVLMYLYYYLYGNDRDGSYNYIRRLLNMKKNIPAQNDKKLPRIKTYYGQVKACEL